jgi:hypothetical protein
MDLIFDYFQHKAKVWSKWRAFHLYAKLSPHAMPGQYGGCILLQVQESSK